MTTWQAVLSEAALVQEGYTLKIGRISAACVCCHECEQPGGSAGHPCRSPAQLRHMPAIALPLLVVCASRTNQSLVADTCSGLHVPLSRSL